MIGDGAVFRISLSLVLPSFKLFQLGRKFLIVGFGFNEALLGLLFVDLAHDLLGHLVELLLFYRGKLRPPDHFIIIHLLELLQDGLSVL